MPGPEDEKDPRPKTSSGEEKAAAPSGDSFPTEGFAGPDSSQPSLAALRQRYDVLAELGRGGMGIAYKARDRETGETVALKVLKPEIAAYPEIVERFKSELRLARKITHKSVCRTHELLRFDSTVVIAMEYVEGESLRRILDRFAGVPLRRGLEWASQICGALAEAHSQGVVHRDLKPENILIDKQGVAKVMDFGIARSIEAGVSEANVFVGTPAYMSPEQAEGKPADARSDIYSLGLILYEMFTGQRTFHADTPAAFMHKHVHDMPTPPREVERLLPGFLDRAIWKCLEKNPGKRFQSAEELEAALTEKPEAKPAAASGEEVELPVHLTRWQRSDWLLVLSSIVGLALFFPFFNRTSLAPRSKVSFDRSVLRRIAQEYAQRLGAPVVGEGRIGTYEFPEMYDFVAERAGASASLELCNNPVPYWTWYVAWENGTQIWVDNHGALSTFERDFPAGAAPERLSLEEARPLAEKAIRDHFGREASELVLESAASDAWIGRPAVSFTWADRNDYHGMKRRYVVRLVGGEIANLSRDYDLPVGYVGRDILPVWQLIPWLGFLLILVLLGFSQRHLVDLGARWRVVSAAAVSVASIWLMSKTPLQASAKTLVLPTFGLANGVTTFFALIPTELSVRRLAPAKLVSLVRLFTSKAGSEPCALAILRGTGMGLALLGADTFFVWLVTIHLSRSAAWLDSLLHVVVQALGFLRSPWFSVDVLYAELQVTILVLLLAFFISFMVRLVRRPWLAVLLAAGLSVLIAPVPFLSMGAVQPYHWKALLLLFDFLVLGWTFIRFDVLTLAWAAFTFAFCWENYDLLVMLTPAGVVEPWIAFAIFGLFVLAAAGIAFKSSLKAAYRRTAAAFE